MSGTIGHTMYAMLGAKAATQRRLAIGAIIRRHWPSYLAGSYLGCDVQTPRGESPMIDPEFSPAWCTVAAAAMLVAPPAQSLGSRP